MSVHAVKRTQAHLAWDNSIPPVLHVASGDTVTFNCLDASNGQITPASTAAALAALDFARLDQVNGPVHVAGAAPGDVLRVDVLRVAPAHWGWTACLPGFGLLADEFPAPALKLWALEWDDAAGAGHAWFDDARRITIPLRPFAGEMGVAPGKDGAFSTIPPYRTGGNIDTRHVCAGATLYLPVEVPGALFSIGDGHAAQGDGEVCGTAIETPVRVTVRLTVLKDRPYVQTPHFRTPAAPAEEYYCTTGVDSDIREATRAAVRHMVAFLGAEHGLARVDAYMLCSVAGDLRMHEVVDMPNYVIGMMMPKSIFTHGK
ncbi:Formamidase [Wolfiporia cocos MD-104 SS10]|uniref:Formamidase n=1 Tax=Wolfiporia cocos (strain MD-104) TaxID=742152 RepID=A0A2H3JQS2_WOLCO|nr:Formamidase [Wolfiporia cocos MD-104 SS10]